MAASDTSPILEIRRISVADTIGIRHAVLWPDKPVEHVSLPEDDSGYHFGAFLAGEGAPVAVISLFEEAVPNRDQTDALRFRKFACHGAYQGRGIGSSLLTFTLAQARDELGARVVWCDARTATADWYVKRGLMPFGDKFEKSSVEYIRMSIEL